MRYAKYKETGIAKCWRLPGFDYSRPYYYMVTLKRLDGLLPFSAIVAPGRCEMSAITRAFVHVIRVFHERVAGLCPIECFTVMPDHLHLLIKIAGEVECKTLGFTSAGKTLSFYVEELAAALSRAYWEVCAKAGGERAERLVSEARATKRFPPIFSPDWHDWIVKCEGQLAEFTRYIRENPKRSWLRKTHSCYFQRVNEIEFLGHKWYGYGNAALLKLPVLEPMRYSRKFAEGCDEWNAAVARAERIGPGGAGVGTFALAGDGARADQGRALRSLPSDGQYRRRGTKEGGLMTTNAKEHESVVGVGGGGAAETWGSVVGVGGGGAAETWGSVVGVVVEDAAETWGSVVGVGGGGAAETWGSVVGVGVEDAAGTRRFAPSVRRKYGIIRGYIKE